MKDSGLTVALTSNYRAARVARDKLKFFDPVKLRLARSDLATLLR